MARRTLVVWVLGGLMAWSPSETHGQLRPIDPIDWAAIDAGDGFGLSIGMAHFSDQRASLAGTQGRLLELGAFRGTWSRAGIVFEYSGTALRVFRDDSTFAAPVANARATNGEDRVDLGDQRLSTTLLLTDGPGPFDAALRFGVRLPTTDNRIGLERDQTDFFATAGARYSGSVLSLAAELGMGVLGTRNEFREQIDPILYSVTAWWRGGWLEPEVTLVGQHDTRPRAELRGNEDLTELRLGLRTGTDRWMRLQLIKGLRDFSPGLGLVLEAGITP